jgi:hypothetical protein
MKKIVGVLALLACGPTVYECGQCCEDYVACSYKSGVTPGSLDSTYGASGSCWATTATSSNCNAACQMGNDNFKASGVAADAGCLFTM